MGAISENHRHREERAARRVEKSDPWIERIARVARAEVRAGDSGMDAKEEKACG